MRFHKFLKSFAIAFCFVCSLQAQDPQPTKTPEVVGEVNVVATKANIDPLYVKLRKISEDAQSFSGEYATVNNLTLKKDAGIFTLKSGEIYFLKPADGKIIGAVFFGEGEFSLTPPVESEKRMLKFFTESADLKEQFDQLVIFFTDETFDEIKKSSNAKISTNGSQASKARDAYRDKEAAFKTDFRYNITARYLMDSYSPPRPGFFTCFIQGKKHSQLLYQIDPLGIESVSPEQVMLLNYSDTGRGIWTAFHLENEYKKGTATSSQDRRVFDLKKHEIDATLRGTTLIASDKITMNLLVPGQRVLPFSLFPSLRVKRVIDEQGQEVNIIQEDKNRDGDLSIILAQAPEVGKPFTLTFEYEGTEAVRQAGNGNYILFPRSTWYPNNGGTQFGDRALFDITFHYPKKFTMIGVGEQITADTLNGDIKTSKWSTKNVEMAVAGFNYGDFIKKEIKDTVTNYGLEVLVNREMPDEIKNIQYEIDRMESSGARTATTLGAMSTSSMADTVLVEAQNSSRIYDSFFGKLPFNRIAMTQQPNTFFGQAWATLIYMPYMAFIGSTQRVQLFGLRGGTQSFWREVAAHEVAHQWWGHAVGWTSYHDQWMSEGFAEFSTSLYIQYSKKDLDKFNDFWEQQRRQITEASPATKDKKPYTVGPITQGYRLNTAKTGNVAQNLIYPKGAYVLQMLRMLMYDSKTGDAKFRAMMKDFIVSHFNKDVSTEDFKRITEKHITPVMDVDKNGKMDWFFDQWVYGTEVPAYKLEYKINQVEGKPVLTGKITQSGVSDNFIMPIPIYLDFGNGWVHLGKATIVGNQTMDLGNIPLPQIPKKVAICAISDVLATKIENIKQ